MGNFSSWLHRTGSMTITEGAGSLWRWIKEMKLKTLADILLACGMGVAFCFALGPFLHYLLDFLSTSLSMVIGMTDSSHYEFFDDDLAYTVPFCLIIAVLVGMASLKYSWICGLSYFIGLMAVLEIWDFCHIEKGVLYEWLGAACYVIMFIVVPILILVRYFSIIRDIDDDDDEDDDLCN